MRVAFVSAFAVNDGNAYEHRLDSLCRALADSGVTTTKIQLQLGTSVLGAGGLGQLSAAWVRMPWADWDYFHVGGSVVPGMLALQRRSRRARIIFDAHGLASAEAEMLGNRRGARIRARALYMNERLSARMADLCVSMSTPMVDRLIQWRGGPEGVGLVRNGVDIELFSPAPVPTATGDRFVVCYAGGFHHYQAVDLLVEAAERLRTNPKIRFRIIGFGPSEQALKQSIRLRIPEAELVDRLDRSSLVALLRSSDLLVLPRRWHLATHVALPTKFAEYLAMAKPVLVNDVDETGDLVRVLNCGFVARVDGSEMAATIERASTMSDVMLAEMGRRGREYVERELVWDVVAGRYRTFLESHL